jgi:hypothetical protein
MVLHLQQQSWGRVTAIFDVFDCWFERGKAQGNEEAIQARLVLLFKVVDGRHGVTGDGFVTCNEVFAPVFPELSDQLPDTLACKDGFGHFPQE